MDPETWSIVRDGQDPTIAYLSTIYILKEMVWLILLILFVTERRL